MIDEISTEIAQLFGSIQTMSQSTSRTQVYELVTRERFLFERCTESNEAFVSNLSVALDVFEADHGLKANDKIQLRNAMLGILEAFRKNYDAGKFVRTGAQQSTGVIGFDGSWLE
ncbi:MAG TPA: hypothetical protein PKZ32_09225 [Candidatus Melainabacteria bacterium]|nr:hypothetical protein [Candidatus Melainabacteria bacterium]